jgi:hypothetical protein
MTTGQIPCQRHPRLLRNVPPPLLVFYGRQQKVEIAFRLFAMADRLKDCQAISACNASND